jgi:hypothetical protein
MSFQGHSIKGQKHIDTSTELFDFSLTQNKQIRIGFGSPKNFKSKCMTMLDLP